MEGEDALEFKAYEDSINEEEEDVIGDNESHHVMVVSRMLSVHQTIDRALEQRKNIFHTRSKANNKVCLVIIDGGSCTNCVSLDFFKKANIPTESHSKPYKPQWLDERGEIKVSRQARILLDFGHFTDDVVCDVVPMDACHVLLVRPWEFDRQIVKDGVTNVYSVRLENRQRCKLSPLSPFEIVKSQLKMQKERQKEKKKKNKKE